MPGEDWPLQHFLNLGHRGAPEIAPENTIPSFAAALEAGADGVELDVRLSRDGAVVVMHNRTVNKTTDGKGPVSKKTLAELKALDAGVKFSPAYAGTPVPTLEEAIAALPKHAFINIETKSGALAGYLLEQKVAALVSGYDLYRMVIVSSFNPFSLARLKQIDGRIPVGLLYLPFLRLDRRCLLNRFKPEALHPHYSMVNSKFMSRARARGYKVYAWTVDAAAKMMELLDLGVDGIITNRPDLLRKLLREREQHRRQEMQEDFLNNP